jgi:hypothetical protein
MFFCPIYYGQKTLICVSKNYFEIGNIIVLLCAGRPFATDFIHGVVAYGAQDGELLDLSNFGIVKSEIVPGALGKANVSGTFTHGDDCAYLGRVIAAPLISNRSKFGGHSNKWEASLTFYSRLWNALSKPGDLVGDLLCGSGAGAVAALLSGRNCIAIDNNQQQVFLYCDFIA